MWKLRLLTFVAARLGIELTFAARFFDEKSQSRGRTLWTSDSVTEAIANYTTGYRLNREKTNGTIYFYIEAGVAHANWDGKQGVSIDDDQLPLALREPVQDGTEDGPDGAGAQETETAQAEGTAGGGAEPELGAGAEAPAEPVGPVEGVKPKIDLADLGVR